MSSKRKVGLLEGFKYQGGETMLAWMLHRVTGLAILLFVGLHVLASFMSYSLGLDYGKIVNVVYESWAFQLVIFFCILFHAINGMRVIVMDLWPALLEFQHEAIWTEWLIFLPVYGVVAFIIVSRGLSG